MKDLLEDNKIWADKEIEYLEKQVCSKCYHKIYTKLSKETGLCMHCRSNGKSDSIKVNESGHLQDLERAYQFNPFN